MTTERTHDLRGTHERQPQAQQGDEQAYATWAWLQRGWYDRDWLQWFDREACK